MKKKLTSIATAAYALALAASPVYAQWPPSGGLTGDVDVKSIIGRVITGVLALVGAIAVLYLVYGGIMYITSAGDKMKVEQAKSILTAAVTGMVIAIAAYIGMRMICTWICGGDPGCCGL